MDFLPHNAGDLTAYLVVFFTILGAMFKLLLADPLASLKLSIEKLTSTLNTLEYRIDKLDKRITYVEAKTGILEDDND